MKRLRAHVRLLHKEVFVPLHNPPGDAQADFGEEPVVIGGIELSLHGSDAFRRLFGSGLSSREQRELPGKVTTRPSLFCCVPQTILV